MSKNIHKTIKDYLYPYKKEADEKYIKVRQEGRKEFSYRITRYKKEFLPVIVTGLCFVILNFLLFSALTSVTGGLLATIFAFIITVPIATLLYDSISTYCAARARSESTEENYEENHKTKQEIYTKNKKNLKKEIIENIKKDPSIVISSSNATQIVERSK